MTSDILIKYGFLLAFIIAMIGIGFLNYKHTKTVSGFFLGGKKAGAWVSAFAYGTTYFSAVLFIGYAGKNGWVFGVSSVWIGFFNAIIGSLLAWVVLAKRTRTMTHTLSSKTMPEFFEARYDSKFLKYFSAIIIFVFLVPYSASVYMGLGYLFETTFGIPYIYFMAAMAIVTTIYLVLGGYLATVITDFFQGIIMIIGVLLMVFFILGNEKVGGFAGGLEQLRQIAQTTDNADIVSIFGGKKWVDLLALIVLTSFGSWGLPQMIHKFYAIKDENSIKVATIVSTAFALLIACSAYFVGSLARLFLNNTLPEGGYDVVMPKVVETLPVFVMSIILLLVLSASMSTLASIVITSSSAIAIDLVKGGISPNMKQESVVSLSRILCVVFIVLSFAIAASKPVAILQLMSFSWGTVSGSFIGPYLLGLYWKGTTKLGAIVGMTAGFLTSTIWAVSSKFDGSLAPKIAMVAFIVSILSVIVVSLFTEKFSQNHLNKVFKNI